MSQSKVPVQKIKNILSERSFADLLFHVFITCGRNEMVVPVAASKPMIVAVVIL